MNSSDRLILNREDILSLLDILELKTFDYVTATENKQYFLGKIDGIMDARQTVKYFFWNKLDKK